MDAEEEGQKEIVPLKASTVTARATWFNLSLLRAAKCVYMPTERVLACVLPPRISVRAPPECTAPAVSPGETENETEGDRTWRQATRRTGFFPPADHMTHFPAFYC